jgi:ubiquinone/menaquinone biosynthesis C-methylase UbiE
MFNKYITMMWQEAMARNLSHICNLIDTDSKATVLDVGCGDGKETIMFKKKTGSTHVVGIDGQEGRLAAAKKYGVDRVVRADLEKKWPCKNGEFDVVVSNQVIEHMVNIDHFISEIYRVLKKGGYCVISTENLSSWHNVGALFLGYQDFSHHLIKKSHITNPLSLHYKEKTATWSKNDHSGVDDSAYPHVKIPTYRSLREMFTTYGFVFEAGRGSGYYPLFGLASAIASRTDPYHSHFITVKMRKPL